MIFVGKPILIDIMCYCGYYWCVSIDVMPNSSVWHQPLNLAALLPLTWNYIGFVFFEDAIFLKAPFSVTASSIQATINHILKKQHFMVIHLG